MEKTRNSIFRTIFGMMISPSNTLSNALNGTKWYITAIISSMAFGLFFIQTGIDLYKTGQKGIGFVLLSGISGFLYGLIIIPLLAVLVYGILKLAKTDKTIIQVISSFCLSYSGALIYGILGLLFSMFLGWKTSVAFGVTGVLWAIGPMIVSVREMLGGNITLCILLSTVVSTLVLTSWSILGNI